MAVEKGIPIVPEERFRQALEHLPKRRQWLRRFVLNDGWEWEAVRPRRSEERTGWADDP
ncbi:MAG: hypothetical protein KY468_15325 [Armatimonadetes bacterium]|nr:hypothetical protein [Armatimonadota bacterium]